MESTFRAVVLNNEQITEELVQITVHMPKAFEHKVMPGMFGHIKVPNAPDHLLRRPISIMDADEKQGTLTFVIQPKGEGTKLIAAVKKQQQLDIIAPLGNPFNAENAKTVWAVGGGVGIAPILFFSSYYDNLEVTTILGFRNEKNVFISNKTAHPVTCTDDGSLGVHGTVVDVMKTMTILPDLITACGPAPMLKAIKAFAAEKGVKCQLSMEQHMGCGYGACLTCSCGVTRSEKTNGYARVCADGPVFDSSEVVF